ncbi:transcription repressor OFP1-like [Canna indica]|uniref:Transcription repressor n=1 Tax=Canna indica TaxID=4628 RepID=A0AAQ3KXM0_9LILI|nr:transcription repressor OFP1-like [Canna indica]
MGKYRFRLSDMMPNAWFYKLKDMSHRANKNNITGRGQASRATTATAASTMSSKSIPPPQKLVPNRGSCYYSSRTEAERFSFSPTHSKALDTQFPVESPRKSKKLRSRKKPVAVVKPKQVSSPVSAGCSCRAWEIDSIPEFSAELSPPCQRDYYIDGETLPFHKITLDDEQFEYDVDDDFTSWPRPCSCRLTSSATDIIIDVGSNNSIARKLDEFDSAAELNLPPIITKLTSREAAPAEFEDKNMVDDAVIDQKIALAKHKQQNKSQANNKSSPGLHRLRMRTNSPRLANRKVQAHRGRRSTTSMQQKKSLSASLAVVKSSSDPQKDFRDSMLEMIAENNIRASKDLEELLACYLSLNSNEYHDVIVKVFEQIWFDLTNIKL